MWLRRLAAVLVEELRRDAAATKKAMSLLKSLLKNEKGVRERKRCQRTKKVSENEKGVTENEKGVREAL